MSFFSGKRVLITGGAGFVGSHLVRELVRLKAKVKVLVRPGTDLWRLQDVADQTDIIPLELGIQGISSQEAVFNEIDLLYHLAAEGLNPPLQGSFSLVRSNVVGTLELLNLAVTLKVKRFVYCGSCFEYASGEMLSEENLPSPISEYAASKSAAWLFVQAFYHRYRLPVVTLRSFTVYGPYEAPFRLIPYTINKALEGKEIDLTLGEQTRDFIFVDDLIRAFLMAGEDSRRVGETFNICTGQAISVQEIVKKVVQMVGSSSSLKFGAHPYRDLEIMKLSGDPSKARNILGWSANISLEEGLRRTIQWFRENRSRYPQYRFKNPKRISIM